MGTPGYPYLTQQFVATGVNTYALLEVVPSAFNIFVMVNGLVQLPNVDYEISGTVIVFNSIPIQGSDIEIRYFGPIDPGYRGSVGYQGSQGVIGPTGFRGSIGAPGYMGSAGKAEVYMQESPPEDPQDVRDGTLWWDTDNGILNIYYGDETTWVGIAEGPRGPIGFTGSQGDIGPIGPPGPAGPEGPQGAPGLQGIPGGQGPEGKQGVKGDKGDPGDDGIIGYTGSSGSNVEDVVVIGTVAGQTVCNVLLGNVFDVSPSVPFSVNFTNVSSRLGVNKTTTFVVIVRQPSTPFVPGFVYLDGVQKTVKWQAGNIPTGFPNAVDAVSFTIIRTSFDTILGQLISFE